MLKSNLLRATAGSRRVSEREEEEVETGWTFHKRNMKLSASNFRREFQRNRPMGMESN